MDRLHPDVSPPEHADRHRSAVAVAIAALMEGASWLEAAAAVDLHLEPELESE